MIQSLSFLEELRSRGMRISASGENLRVNAPKGTLTPEVKQLLRIHKAEIIRHLAQSKPLNAQDIFAGENPSVRYVISSISGEAGRLEMKGGKLLLDMPTVAAYQAERALCAGVARHAAGQIPETSLDTLLRNYFDTHTLSDKTSAEWTDKSVPLFYLTVFLDGVRLESYNCNQIQAWIVRQYWLVVDPKTTTGVVRL